MAVVTDYPIFANSTQHCDVAASTTLSVGVGNAAGGAAGDYLSHITIHPGTAGCGTVTLTDGTGSAVTIFAGGGTTALSSLIPFTVVRGSKSLLGAWKIITGANVTATAFGQFT